MVMEIVVSLILLFVGIGVLVIIHVCVVGRAFRGDPAVEGQSAPTRFNRIPGMKAEEIEKLPSFDYAVKGKEMMNVECAVCLEVFREGEKCRVLPKCSHSFHGECIDSWLLKTAACPICRGAAAAANSSLFGDGAVDLV